LFFYFRSELGDNVEELTPKLGAVIAACEEIINSHSLTEFLGFTLQTGNFINTVLPTNSEFFGRVFVFVHTHKCCH